ncbi:hypothetical protein BD410DRAFT_789581 [Rickenella mellea]|uniref:GST N-terminal domain-containing protein n=1 Tax=Rickenella mellea TaxID=50990 RepID=A0A4Y7Q238_9AGAM|nr:hypothetical protein BD410DRAFT_789581 [Rickenella mellea]
MAKYQLFASPTSPFVHKVLIAAVELGLQDQIGYSSQIVNVFSSPNDTVCSTNPLGKIPALILPSGSPIFGSSVIVQYLDSVSSKNILPAYDDPKRYDSLTFEALGDGILEAALLIRYELTGRDFSKQNEVWITAQHGKIERGLKHLMKVTLPPPDTPAPLPIEGISVASVLWYLEGRFPTLAWWEWPGGFELKGWYEKVKGREGWLKYDFPKN